MTNESVVEFKGAPNQETDSTIAHDGTYLGGPPGKVTNKIIQIVMVWNEVEGYKRKVTIMHRPRTTVVKLVETGPYGTFEIDYRKSTPLRNFLGWIIDQIDFEDDRFKIGWDMMNLVREAIQHGTTQFIPPNDDPEQKLS
ncbi:hypothetical protein SAMN05444392_10661 [Seinonella peptonophila]|uniref:Uncharacterized protein n=1 Tax=Seinonella peptonophila TaxID=112248 RepID=A0A1M4Y694_9BACL|nr:hypothetical protein [Seinonella peptonophila]SHF01093.1 hypothetical protein SAMN05444392_10661 [Seinonella peptonophila]